MYSGANTSLGLIGGIAQGFAQARQSAAQREMQQQQIDIQKSRQKLSEQIAKLQMEQMKLQQQLAQRKADQEARIWDLFQRYQGGGQPGGAQAQPASSAAGGSSTPVITGPGSGGPTGNQSQGGDVLGTMTSAQMDPNMLALLESVSDVPLISAARLGQTQAHNA